MVEKPADRSPWWLALAGIIGAVVGGAITGGFNYLGHKGDVDAKMIELSVGILRSEPKQETEPLREWAIDVIDKRAKFSFNEKQRAILLKKELPFRSPNEPARGPLCVGGDHVWRCGADEECDMAGMGCTSKAN